jgi:hypothetical protein
MRFQNVNETDMRGDPLDRPAVAMTDRLLSPKSRVDTVGVTQE